MPNSSNMLKDRQVWEASLGKRKRELLCFSYLTALRENFEGVLKNDCSIKITLVSFEGGSIIKNTVVEKDNGQTTKLDKIFSVRDAFKIVALEMSDARRVFKGTSIIINQDVCFLIKDNSPREWNAAKAKEDVRSIVAEILPL